MTTCFSGRVVHYPAAVAWKKQVQMVILLPELKLKGVASVVE